MNEYPEESDRRNGDTTRRVDEIGRARLQVIQEGYAHWTHRTLVILCVIAALFFLSAGASTYLYFRINNNQNKLCKESNNRHDNAVKTLNNLIDIAVRERRISPKEAAIVRSSNLLLVNAIAPESKDTC